MLKFKIFLTVSFLFMGYLLVTSAKSSIGSEEGVAAIFAVAFLLALMLIAICVMWLPEKKAKNNQSMARKPRR